MMVQEQFQMINFKTDKPGTGIVTEPNKESSQPVPVTTPARKIPTIKIEQDPDTGDVVTPRKPDGSTYPPGTTVQKFQVKMATQLQHR